MPPLLNWFVEEVTTDTADVDVSGGEIPIALVGDKLIGALLAVVPLSEPFADAAELGVPPALTEESEYIEETDILFESISVIDGLGLNAGSGSCGC